MKTQTNHHKDQGRRGSRAGVVDLNPGKDYKNSQRSYQ